MELTLKNCGRLVVVSIPFALATFVMLYIVANVAKGATNADCVIKEVNISIHDDDALVLATIDVCSDDVCFENRLMNRTLPGARTPVVRREIMHNYYAGRHMACWLDESHQVSWQSSNNMLDFDVTIDVTVLFMLLMLICGMILGGIWMIWLDILNCI